MRKAWAISHSNANAAIRNQNSVCGTIAGSWRNSISESFLSATLVFGMLGEMYRPAVTAAVSDLVPEDLNDLVTIAQNVKFGANEVVFEQGDLGKEMYIVLSGQVKISLRTKEDEEITITHLGAGEAFGEIALFDQRERTATATTSEASEFLVIKREEFVGFLANHSNVAIHFLSEISKRLRETDNLMI